MKGSGSEDSFHDADKTTLLETEFENVACEGDIFKFSFLFENCCPVKIVNKDPIKNKPEFFRW